MLFFLITMNYKVKRAAVRYGMAAHDRPVKVSASIRPVPAIPVRRMESCGLYNGGERIFTTLCPEYGSPEIGRPQGTPLQAFRT